MLVACYFVTSYVEKHAAMRGSHRKPLSPLVDKSLRTFFLAVLVSPLAMLWPWYVIPATLLYLPSFIDGTERRGRPSNWVRGWSLWWGVKRYFRLSIALDAQASKLNPKQQYIIGLHPHGFLPFGTMINLATVVSDIDKLFLNGVQLRTLAASFCFYIPAYRDLILGGGVVDAARYNARRVLDAGLSLSLVPGGATEGLYAMPGNHTLVLRKRRGFVKLALETGAHLVPAFSFGETNCYNQMSANWPWIKTVQRKWQAVTGLSLPLVTNIIPNRATIMTVFGKAIPVTRKAVPTDAEIDALLATYIAALTDLFHRNAPTYIADPKMRGLTII